MVRESVDLLELLRKQASGDFDFLREAMTVLAQALMDAEVTAQVGAGYGERSEEPHDPPLWLPSEALGQARGQHRPADSQASPGELLPGPA